MQTIQSFSRPRHLSTIPLKNFHLFKIVELVISFYFKNFFNPAIFKQVKVF